MSHIVNISSELPDTQEALYVRIHKALERDIREQASPGASLESENKLAERFKVNRHTIRRAIDELVGLGLVERRRGVGLFVLDPAVFDYTVAPESRVTSNLTSLGYKSKSEVLRRHIEPASGLACEWLQVEKGEPLICLETVRTADERPFSWIRHLFPYKKFRTIFDDYESGSLHKFIQDQYGYKLKRQLCRLSADMANEKDASTLLIPEKRPLLCIKSLNIHSETGQPMEFSSARNRGDRMEVTVNF